MTEETIRIPPSQLCSKIQTRKVRQNLTEAEKEARRLCRILANRESARQTIRRRQEMHLELIRKVAHLSEENKNLKKEKELAVKKYDSLKGSNEFLKLQIANKRHVVSKERQELNTLGSELFNSATKRTPTLLYNQPLVPFLLPSVIPCPHVQHPYVPHPEVLSSSQLPIEHKDLPTSHQGQEMSLGNTGLGNTLFVLPVPWLLPLHTYSNALNSKSDPRESKGTPSHQGGTSAPLNVLFVNGNHQSSSNPSMKMETSNFSRPMPMFGPRGAECTFPLDCSHHLTMCHLKHALLAAETSGRVRSVERPGPTGSPQAHDINNLNNISAPEHILRTLVKKQHGTLFCHLRKSEKTSAGLQARRRRRELIRMRNSP